MKKGEKANFGTEKERLTVHDPGKDPAQQTCQRPSERFHTSCPAPSNRRQPILSFLPIFSQRSTGNADSSFHSSLVKARHLLERRLRLTRHVLVSHQNGRRKWRTCERGQAGDAARARVSHLAQNSRCAQSDVGLCYTIRSNEPGV